MALARPTSSAFAAFLLVALSGCASLPPPPERDPSSAFTYAQTAGTRLAGLADASLEGSGAGESGFRLLPTGDFSFDARVALARRAERSLDVQYYQLKRDSVGLQILRELRAAARRGVRVRLLVDDLYTAGEDELLRSFAALPNVEVRLFNPLPSRASSLGARVLLSLHEFSRINHRMHNKLFVADNRFAVSGGRNLGEEYFMRSAQANFIDMDVVSAGPVVREMSQVFDRYWNSALAWPVQNVVVMPLDAATGARRFDEVVRDAAPELAPATSDPLGRPSVELELEAGRMVLDFAAAEVFADTPDKAALNARDEDASTVTRSVLEELKAARSEILITSPYFIPGKVGMAAMRAAIARGVRVGLLTNGVGATDEPLVHWRYARYRRELLQLGVEIHELSPSLARESEAFGAFGKSFRRLHAKVVVIDHRKVFIGSMNFDARSAWSNTEAGLLIDSPALAEKLHGLIANDRGESIYRLRLAEDGRTIEWVARGADGQEHAVTDEPDNSWLLRLKMFLLEPFASEELL